jgi:hypothetical protein
MPAWPSMCPGRTDSNLKTRGHIGGPLINAESDMKLVAECIRLQDGAKSPGSDRPYNINITP